MNTDKNHPKPGFLALGVPSPEGKAEQSDCQAEPGLQNLCSSVLLSI